MKRWYWTIVVMAAMVGTAAEAQERPDVLFRFQQQRADGGLFGRAIAGMESDVSGDGVLDMLVSSAVVADGGAYTGRVYMLNGKTGKALRSVSPRGGRVSAQFGVSVGGLRDDANEDGKMDWWLGDADTIFVMSGLDGTVLRGVAMPKGEKSGHWGESVAALGDLNADTLGDLVIETDKGIYAWNIKENKQLYHTPLSAARVFKPDTRPPFTTLRRLGDVSDDGVSEWLVGRMGTVYVGDGASGKVRYSVQTHYKNGNDQFGIVVASLRDDMDDDDRGDFAVAAPWTTLGTRTAAGMVHVYSGKEGKLRYSIVPRNPSIDGHFGYYLEHLYDRNGDCINDWLIGDNLGNGATSLAIYSGKDGKWIEDIALPFDANTTYGGLASVASAGGDIDKNNSEDILLHLHYQQARPNELVGLSPKTLYPPLRIRPADSIVLDYGSDKPLILSATESEQFKSYQWFWNGEEIPNAQLPQVEVGAGGRYTVRVPIPCIETLEASVEVPIPPSDTPVQVLLGRLIQVDKEIIVHSRTIEVRVWDDKKEDGDYISLNFNGKWILKNHLLSWNQKIVPLTIEPDQENIFCMYALNQGSIPPNTAAISIKDGSESHFFVIRSDFRRSGTVRILYKPK